MFISPPSGMRNFRAGGGCDRVVSGGGDSGQRGHARPPDEHHHGFFAL